MNELDFLLVFVVLFGVAVGLRRGLIRVMISIVGIYFTVLVAGYVYRPMGGTLAEAFGLGMTMMHNFSYLVAVVCMTVVVELASRSFFEDTRLVGLRELDNLLGGIVGIVYGALWASLLLMPVQYGIARTGGAWAQAVLGSKLLPTLNDFFRVTVLEIVSLLFVDDAPPLYKSIYRIL